MHKRAYFMHKIPDILYGRLQNYVMSSAGYPAPK